MTRARRRDASSTARALVRIALCAAAAALLLGGCAGSGQRSALPMPAVSSLRAAAEPLLVHVEHGDEPPAWINQQRVENDVLYGVGIHAGRGQPERDLFMTMRSARESIIAWLEARGARAESPHDLLPPLAIDDEAIGFERLAHDERRNRWYALARFDLAEAAREVASSSAELDDELSRARLTLVDDSYEHDERVRAALVIVYGLARRQQLQSAYHAITGEMLPLGEGLDDASLQERADDLLDGHGVRVLVEGIDAPGLHDQVSSVMGEVHLRADEFGRGLIAIRLMESDSFGAGYPYLQLDGQVEVAIEGGDARSYSEPIHIVSSGVDASEARYRAARSLRQEVGEIVRRTLRSLGNAGG